VKLFPSPFNNENCVIASEQAKLKKSAFVWCEDMKTTLVDFNFVRPESDHSISSEK
jgi:hypothetical protein